MKLSPFLLSSLILLAGCTPSTPSTTAEPPEPQPRQDAREWTIDFDVSGGFAGVHQHLSISNDGIVVATDRKADRWVERTLEPEELARLEGRLSRLEASPPQQMQSPWASKCADCVNYLFTAIINDKPHRLSSRTGEKLDQETAELFAHLSTLLKETLAGGGNRQ